MKTFTEVEKTIARNIDWEYKWMARDQDGNLCIYEEKPEKEGNYWNFGGYDYISYFNHLFPAIKWEDDEPTLIRDIYNPPILDESERQYLSAVIKPFRDHVRYICKGVCKSYSQNKEFQFIKISIGKGVYDSIIMPGFAPDTMYQGMELSKDYTPEELGL